MTEFFTWANALPFPLMVLVGAPIGVILGVAGAALISWLYNWRRKWQS